MTIYQLSSKNEKFQAVMDYHFNYVTTCPNLTLYKNVIRLAKNTPNKLKFGHKFEFRLCLKIAFRKITKHK